MDALLFALVAGVVVLAVGVDVGMVLAWMRRRSNSSGRKSRSV
jgi:hypothetical protein